MVDTITLLIPYLVLASHIVLGIIAISLFVRSEWARQLKNFLGEHSLLLGFMISLCALVGSLFYSDLVGFEACVLCWWQRVFLYPLVVIFGVAFWKKDNRAFLYAVPLAILALIIALYHAYTSLGGTSLLPCTAVGGDCAKVYVLAFGYITIPVMSLTVALYVLLLAWFNKISKDKKQ